MKPTALILSGPTHEYIDPVRFIGNASSGLMGKALAEEAIRRGFGVEFITGPIAEQNLPNLKENGNIHKVVSAEDMLETASKLFPTAQVIIFSAAVADYSPKETHKEKMAKSSNDLILQLRPTPDIAKTLCTEKRDNQIAIGFALQTADGETNARRKLETKNLDGILLNSPTSLGAPNGTFSFFGKEMDAFEHWGCIDKTECAAKLFNTLPPEG
ncbi:MAG TPA: phosphopantothenoylcysteine decarboxylase [Pontiella sp.]